ncbi:MAG: hypothetical protein AB7F64_04545 [Gammaproteobacteria bacterium]
MFNYFHNRRQDIELGIIEPNEKVNCYDFINNFLYCCFGYQRGKDTRIRHAMISSAQKRLLESVESPFEHDVTSLVKKLLKIDNEFQCFRRFCKLKRKAYLNENNHTHSSLTDYETQELQGFIASDSKNMGKFDVSWNEFKKQYQSKNVSSQLDNLEIFERWYEQTKLEYSDVEIQKKMDFKIHKILENDKQQRMRAVERMIYLEAEKQHLPFWRRQKISTILTILVTTFTASLAATKILTMEIDGQNSTAVNTIDSLLLASTFFNTTVSGYFLGRNIVNNLAAGKKVATLEKVKAELAGKKETLEKQNFSLY